MANKVTGKTDTTGAMSIAPTMPKSVLVIGKVTGSATKSTDPNTVFSITGTSDAQERFGDGSILVKAVKVLVQNGVDNIFGVIVDSEKDPITDGYADALEASLGEASIKVIISDDYTDGVVAEIKTHLAMAESEDMFRYSVVATDKDSRDEIIEYAKTKVSDSRIFIPFPACTDSTGTPTDPVLVAAGMAGVIMSETSDPALPMNGVTINGIGNVDRAVLESERNMLANNGVTAIYNDGAPTIHRLVTSYTTDKIWQEGTTRFIADYVLENVENTLRSNYQRTKNVARILDSIKTTVKGLLENYTVLEIIENFDVSTLTVVKDPTDNYGVLVDYEFDVVTPLYTISINQHMKI